MKLHVFNPEHDMALAANSKHLTLPHAIQEFRMNLGFLPALWAKDGDFVLVEDVMFATKALAKLNMPHADVLFVTVNDLKHLLFSSIEPWGWDRTIKQTLVDAGLSNGIMPKDAALDYIRRLSSRIQTTEALPLLRRGIEHATCGECFYCTTMPEVDYAIIQFGRIVVKALWSSSGRGVKYTDGRMSETLRGWIAKTISRQGGIMVEPYYKKVKDFAFEYYAHGDGNVDYVGLSLFETNKSSYAGNMIATEEDKMNELCKLLPEGLLTEVKLRVRDYFTLNTFRPYSGPLGVDMMVVANNEGGQLLLHPCVEINVRRTMGHVANSIKTSPTKPAMLMRIVHDVNYKLKFEWTENNFVKVI